MICLTLRITATLTQLKSNISFTSRDTVKREGTSTLLFRSMKISISSSSLTIANGQWRCATQIASFILNFCGVYIEPCANVVMELELAAMVPPSQALAW